MKKHLSLSSAVKPALVSVSARFWYQRRADSIMPYRALLTSMSIDPSRSRYSAVNLVGNQRRSSATISGAILITCLPCGYSGPSACRNAVGTSSTTMRAMRKAARARARRTLLKSIVGELLYGDKDRSCLWPPATNRDLSFSKVPLGRYLSLRNSMPGIILRAWRLARSQRRTGENTSRSTNCRSSFSMDCSAAAPNLSIACFTVRRSTCSPLERRL
mmetsp:Transcript_8560/g.14198  ORF Transcript_8560/g.14198 Transcript_8560/m.14198 type:complete len:217 (+) Transcript_8560:1341-1991(+)